MTPLESPEFWRFWRIQEKAKKRPRRGQGRPEEARKGPKEAGQEEARRGPEEARKRPGRGQEEARRGPKKPGIQNLAKNCSKRNVLCKENDVSGGF